MFFLNTCSHQSAHSDMAVKGGRGAYFQEMDIKCTQCNIPNKKTVFTFLLMHKISTQKYTKVHEFQKPTLSSSRNKLLPWAGCAQGEKKWNHFGRIHCLRHTANARISSPEQKHSLLSAVAGFETGGDKQWTGSRQLHFELATSLALTYQFHKFGEF